MSNVPEVRDALLKAAVEHAVVPAAPVSSRRPKQSKRRVAAIGVILAFGCAGAAAAQMGVFEASDSYAPGAGATATTPVEDLSPDTQASWPALSAPHANAPKSLRDLFAGDGRFDVRRAREIPTATGPGFVFPASNGGVCMAVSETPQTDARRPAWTVGCSRPGDTDSLRLSFVDEQGGQAVTALAPTGSKATIVDGSGASRDARIVDGVVSVNLRPGERLAFKYSN